MKCPTCQNTLEEKSYRGDIHVDECLWCKGVWFDPGELETYREAVRRGTEREGLGPSTFQATDGNAEKLFCPRCNTKTLVQGAIRSIQLHQCETCHGIHVSGEQIAELNHDTRPNSPVIDALFLLRILSLGARF
jgi:Zn-finger nucleic acid-binding protein